MFPKIGQTALRGFFRTPDAPPATLRVTQFRPAFPDRPIRLRTGPVAICARCRSRDHHVSDCDV